jgi:hypothetical protein
MNVIPTMLIHQPTPPMPPPPSAISFPTPLSYEFQVVERIDDENKITKVALQMKVNQHDQYGNITVHGTWNDVPRVQVKF